MAVQIVDLLETVEVDQNQGNRAGMALGKGELRCQVLLQVPPVVDAGQRIAMSEILQRAQRALLVLFHHGESKGHSRAEPDQTAVAQLRAADTLINDERTV